MKYSFETKFEGYPVTIHVITAGDIDYFFSVVQNNEWWKESKLNDNYNWIESEMDKYHKRQLEDYKYSETESKYYGG